MSKHKDLMNYLEPPDVPEGLTIREWRMARLTARGGQRVTLVRRLRLIGRRWSTRTLRRATA